MGTKHHDIACLEVQSIKKCGDFYRAIALLEMTLKMQARIADRLDDLYEYSNNAK